MEDPNLPSRVIDLRAVVSSNTVELTWAAPARSGSGKIARYEVRHAPGSTVPSGTGWRSAQLRRFPGAYVDGLENGRRHAFEVRAVNVWERKGAAVRLTATPRAEAVQTLPTAPRGLRAAVEGENLTIDVRRSGMPDPDEDVLAVVEIYDSAFSRWTAKTVDILVGAREATVEFRVPFDGARGAARELAVTLSPGSWDPLSTYIVGTSARRRHTPTQRLSRTRPLGGLRHPRSPWAAAHRVELTRALNRRRRTPTHSMSWRPGTPWTPARAARRRATPIHRLSRTRPPARWAAGARPPCWNSWPGGC